MTEAPSIFKPSNKEGRAYKKHCEGCFKCDSRSSIHDAKCKEGQRLLQVYMESLHQPRRGPGFSSR